MSDPASPPPPRPGDANYASLEELFATSGLANRNVLTCPYCNAQMPAGTRLCTTCHSDIRHVIPAPVEGQRPGPRPMSHREREDDELSIYAHEQAATPARARLMGAAFGVLAFGVLAVIAQAIIDETVPTRATAQMLMQWSLPPIAIAGWLAGAYAAHRERRRLFLVWTPAFRFRPPRAALLALAVWGLAVMWKLSR
jgi:hypothetical protein